MSDSASVLSDFLKLSAQEQRDVLHGLVASGDDVNQERGWQNSDLDSYDVRRFKVGLQCPHCDSQQVIRNGKQADINQHGSSRGAAQTPLSALRKYVHCMCLAPNC